MSLQRYGFEAFTQPPRWPSDRVLASGAGGPGFNPQSGTASHQRCFKNDTSSSLIEHLTLNREILALSQLVFTSFLHVLKIDRVHGY